MSPLTILTRLLATTFLLVVGFSFRAEAQSLFVTDYANRTIGAYTTSGAVVNASLVSGLSGPLGIAVSGSNIYVADNANGTIGAYTTSGAVVNANLVSGLRNPYGIAVSGSNIYVTEVFNGTIGAYTTSGAVVNASLVSGLQGPFGIAVSGSNIYVTDYANGTIGAYTTSGAVVNANLVSGLSSPYFLSLEDVTDIVTGTSVDLNSIGVTANPVLSGGTLVLLSGDNSNTAFSVTSASSIQSPTSGSATLSGVFSGVGGLTFIG
uniref:Vgb family protein n=1 Tax=Orrella sp. TaxID=1921583 RepID=UPI004048B1EF